MHSSDKGFSWTHPINITAQVRRPGWGWMATGPGHGIVTHDTGRLVVPFNTFLSSSKVVMETVQTGCAATKECSLYRPAGSLQTTFTITNPDDSDDPPLSVVGARFERHTPARPDFYANPPQFYSHNAVGTLHVGQQLPPYTWAGDRSSIFFSDDHGVTWQLGGQVSSRIGSSECIATELLGGVAGSNPASRNASALLMSFRVEDKDSGCRKFALSADGGATFGNFFEPEGCIPDPVCQGSILALGGGRVLLASGPGSSTERLHVKVHESRDGGLSFVPLLQVLTVYNPTRQYSDYTDLVQLSETEHAWGVGVAIADEDGIAFATFSVPKTKV